MRFILSTDCFEYAHPEIPFKCFCCREDAINASYELGPPFKTGDFLVAKFKEKVNLMFEVREADGEEIVALEGSIVEIIYLNDSRATPRRVGSSKGRATFSTTICRYPTIKEVKLYLMAKLV